MSKPTYVRFFNEFGNEDVALVGGKNASLGEMYQKLSGQGVRIPNGFATTSDAYRYVLERVAPSWRCTRRSTTSTRATSKTSPVAPSERARLCTAHRSPRTSPTRS